MDKYGPSGFTKSLLLHRQECYTQAPTLAFGGRIFTLTSLFGTDTLPCFHVLFYVFFCSKKPFLKFDPSRDQRLWLVTERRVMRFCEQQRGRLCTETAAGAAVTVAVLLLAPHCSQDEVHRCSHSVHRFIGCLKQCIFVKNSSS